MRYYKRRDFGQDYGVFFGFCKVDAFSLFSQVQVLLFIIEKQSIVQIYFTINRMQQQTQISLNFSEIFSTNDHQPNRTQIEGLEIPPFSQSFEVSNPKYQRDEVTNQSTKSVIETKPFRNPFAFKHKLAPSASQQISNINKLMYSSCVMRINKPISTNIDNLTKRLTATKSCKKIECLNLYRSKLQEPLINQQSSKKKYKLTKTKSLEAFHQPKSINKPNVFDRLHYDGKFKEVKMQNLKKQAAKRIIQQSSPQSRKSRNSSNNEKYLKHYVPFYKRLEGDLTRSFEKAEIIRNNPNVMSQLQNSSFKPKLYPSPYKKLVTSRYLKTISKEQSTSDLANFLNTSIETEKSSLNRSTQIVDRIEQHFFNKMRLIFTSNDSDQVRVTHNSISLLSQIEFEILQGFIMYIQQNRIKISDFDYYIRSYFHNLSTVEKMQLRSHQTQSRFKYTQLDQQYKFKLKMSQREEKRAAKSRKSPIGKTAKFSGNYHLAIQHYI